MNVNLTASIIGKKNADKYLPAIVAMTAKYDINTKQRYCLFMANVLEETGNFSVGVENMNYTNFERIKVVFKGSRSALLTKKLVGNPELLANTVYGGEWGKKNLGNTKEGDGWKYRGRGAMQTTGRAAYAALSKKVFGDNRLIENPDLILEPFTSLEAACFEWSKKGCNELADADRFNDCVIKINGGLTNLASRVKWLTKLQETL
jgi:putative chitinase